MEVRKITIVSTKTQKKSVIMSGAETLGELKKNLRDAGIDYEDMTFYEGTSKTELKTDESILPKDVPYTNRTTGETKNTNELVFMLTNTNKKIRSGAVTMSRVEAYNAIKARGLQAKCQERFGKNFTMCKTSDLVSLIEDSVVDKAATTKSESTVANSSANYRVECVDTQARAAIIELIDALCGLDVIGANMKYEIINTLNNVIAAKGCTSDLGPSYSDNEIDAMFRDMY